jgi:Uma2 family endonuclease
MHARTPPTLYEQLVALPESLTGDIIDGQLHSQPRPSGRHGLAESSLIGELIGPFQEGRGGPGGWWIIGESELRFIRDTDVYVPDIAGWRHERMPQMPEDQRFTVVPDWGDEILSKSTASKDREFKIPAYAEYGIAYRWLIDPLARTLEAYAREGRFWREIGRFAFDDRVAVAPFDAVTTPLVDLWAPSA